MDNPAYTATVREDFDRIASLPEEEGWAAIVRYHSFLLGQLPPALDEAPEVGCGTGAFARALAGRCGRVLALDLSPRTIEVARSRLRGRPNIEYAVVRRRRRERLAVPRGALRVRGLDHHPPPPAPRADVAQRMGAAIRPGGTLLALDLYRPGGYADLPVVTLDFPASWAIRMARTGAPSGPPRSPEVRTL